MKATNIELQAVRISEKFKSYGIKSDSMLEKAIEQASIVVESQAAVLAPIDTGLLKKSISHRIIRRNTAIIGQVGTSVEYAPHQEFGTYKMKAQPFLRPALERKRNSVKMIIEDFLKRAK